MATVTRADALTRATRKVEFFSDFTTSFSKTPIGDQLARVLNDNAVNQSLRNIIKTNLGERPFQPALGSDVYASLFELHSSESIKDLQLFIESAININEPRVNLLKVYVKTVSDAPEVYEDLEGTDIYIPPARDENSIEITIIYNLINNPAPITLTVILKRVR
jgi:phage baseplate assembly protein W